MKQTPLDFRPVRTEDASMLLAWRNDEVTRRNSRRTALVTEPAEIWLETFANERPARAMYIALHDSVPVGLVYADPDGENCCEISYIVAPEQRGQGFGVAMVKSFVQTHLVGVKIKACIFEGNTASENIALFIGLHPVHRFPSEGNTRVLVEWRS